MSNDFLMNNLQKYYSPETIELIINGLKSSHLPTLRINTLKTDKKTVLDEFSLNSIDYEQSIISDDVFKITNANEKKLMELEAYKSGKIYLQNFSSVLPTLFLDIVEKSTILDMASAPGGKTSHIAAIGNNTCSITACEKNPIRADKLKSNLSKLGVKNTTVIQMDATKLDDFFAFDSILLDAPCSGSGTISLDSDNLEKYFNEKILRSCINAQKELFKKAIKLLKINKTMVYSTCSIFKCENEEIIKPYIDKGIIEIIPIELPKDVITLPSNIDGVKTILPHDCFQGFFIAKIRKLRNI